MPVRSLLPLRSLRGIVVVTAGLSAGLSACSEARDVLGWDKKAPDEFRVVSRAPLALPHSFDLTPPVPGATRPQEPDPRKRAERALFGHERAGQGSSADDRSSGERAFLKAAGADRATLAIRGTVDREAAMLALENRTMLERMAFWRDSKGEPGHLVDADRELRRLRQNQALGLPVNDGETPEAKARRKSIFDLLF